MEKRVVYGGSLVIRNLVETYDVRQQSLLRIMQRSQLFCRSAFNLLQVFRFNRLVGGLLYLTIRIHILFTGHRHSSGAVIQQRAYTRSV